MEKYSHDERAAMRGEVLGSGFRSPWFSGSYMRFSPVEQFEVPAWTLFLGDSDFCVFPVGLLLVTSAIGDEL
jgi:hypothetical protein